MRGMILLEGLDLAGKSTLAAHLARALEERGVTVRSSRNSLCPDNPVAELADRIRRQEGLSSGEGASLFLASHLWDVRHFQRPSVGVHIQDSCWLRSLAFDRSQGISEMEMWWREAGGPQFERMIFLTANLEARRQRYHTRSENDSGDHWVFSRPRAFQDLENCLRQEVMRFPQAVEVDTSELDAEQVLERCLQILAADQPLHKGQEGGGVGARARTQVPARTVGQPFAGAGRVVVV